MKEERIRFINISTKDKETKGLVNVNFVVGEGEFVCLMPMNPHGIDDLFSILKGNLEKYEGTAYIDREIGFLNEESILIENLSIAENIFILRNNFKMRVIRSRIINKEARKVLNEYSIFHEPTDLIKTVSLYDRCRLCLIKLFLENKKVIVIRRVIKLLSATERRKLIKFFQLLAGRGVALLYVEELPDEIITQCDRVLIFENGSIRKILFSEQVEALSLMKETQMDFVAPLGDSQSKQAFFRLENQEEDLKVTISKGECITFFDSESEHLHAILSLFSDAQHSTWKIDYLENQQTQLNIFLIPEKPTEQLLFHDCSYLFNLMFLADKKISKSVFPRKFLKSVKKEFSKELNVDFASKNLKKLTNLELLELVYYRFMLVRPEVLIIYQPFTGSDMELQHHLLRLLRRLKRRGISVLILTSYLGNLSTVSETVFKI